MITVEANVDKTFTATEDILIQNTTNSVIKYTTDNTQAEWFNMAPNSTPIQILTGDVVYFRSDRKTALAEMPLLWFHHIYHYVK